MTDNLVEKKSNKIISLSNKKYYELPHISMKIGIVTYALKVGGVETYIKTLATYFLSTGQTVDIIETVSKGQQSDDFKNEGFNVSTILINIFENQYSFANRLANELQRYDVLILNHVPFVHSILGLLNNNTIILPILHNDLKIFYDTVLLNKSQWNKIICVSPALESVLKNKMNLDDKDIITITNGINVRKFCKEKIEKNNIEKPLAILYVGRIEDKQKGVLLLPIIMQNVISKNTNVSLKIIGDGPSLPALNKLISKLELNSTIELLGKHTHIETLHKIYEADILIMPSYYEGLGLVYLEAMAQATVPIVSNLRNNTDLIIKNGKNGYLCNIGDVDCFAETILELEKNRKILKKISYEAWKTARDFLSHEVMGKKYMETIYSCINQNTVKRTNKIEYIQYGHLPYFIILLIQFFNRIIKVLFKIKFILSKRIFNAISRI
jgi:glycosyltransferase involved in cell wall biosynthesis